MGMSRREVLDLIKDKLTVSIKNVVSPADELVTIVELKLDGETISTASNSDSVVVSDETLDEKSKS